VEGDPAGGVVDAALGLRPPLGPQGGGDVVEDRVEVEVAVASRETVGEQGEQFGGERRVGLPGTEMALLVLPASAIRQVPSVNPPASSTTLVEGSPGAVPRARPPKQQSRRTIRCRARVATSCSRTSSNGTEV
jgi:hypothetical protein